MNFKDFVCSDAIITDLTNTDRDDVIAELMAAIDEAGGFGENSCAAITRAIINRENEASTGIGKGIAIPHVKHPGVKNVIATVGKSAAGIDFAALDRQPVYCVILLVSPAADPDKHLQAMEVIFKCVQQEKFRRFLRHASTVEEINDLLREADETPLL